jgi:integrase
MANAKKLPSGNWRVQVYCGVDDNGKAIRKSFTAPTKWEALAAADEFTRDGRARKEKGLTVGDAIDGYIAAKSNVLSPTSISGYREMRRNRLQRIMDVPLDKLTNLKIQQAINDDASRLSAKSIHSAYNLLSATLKMYMPDYPLKATLPAKQPHIKNLPEPGVVLDAILGTKIELPCLLAMWLSLRMSEIRGLQFRDIVGDTLTVQRSMVTVDGVQTVKDQTKTYTSARTLRVPDYILSLIQQIDHKNPDDFIVPLTGQAIYKRFVRIMAKHDIKMTFHDLRHINASVMLALGVPDKYAMERGGWATNHTLKTVYQHTFSAEREAVDNKIDDYFADILHSKLHTKTAHEE